MSAEKTIVFDQDRASEEALLPGRDGACDCLRARAAGRNGRFWGFSNDHLHPFLTRYGWFIHLVVFALYTTLFFSLPQSINKRLDQSWHLKNPARPSIVMENRVLDTAVDAQNPFKGPPRAELDLAWHNVLRHSNIRLTAEELRRMNRTSVPLADGSGDYAGSLDIYHQLHCLKYIRHYVHPEYYDIVKTNVPSVDHVDHCIDSLRQLLMCRADASIQTYEWIPTLRIPWAKFDETEHECTNWEALDNWAAERSFDLYDPGLLRHPTLGPSFPPGWYDEQKFEHKAEPALKRGR